MNFQTKTKKSVDTHVHAIHTSAILLNNDMVAIARHIFNDGNGDVSLANYVVQRALATTMSGQDKGRQKNVVDVSKIVLWFERFGFCRWKTDKESPYGGAFVLNGKLATIRKETGPEHWKEMKSAKNRFFNLQKEVKPSEVKDFDGYKAITTLLTKIETVIEAGKSCNLTDDDLEILKAMVQRHENPVPEQKSTIVIAGGSIPKRSRNRRTPKVPAGIVNGGSVDLPNATA